jgi:hypothetical protein
VEKKLETMVSGEPTRTLRCIAWEAKLDIARTMHPDRPGELQGRL